MWRAGGFVLHGRPAGKQSIGGAWTEEGWALLGQGGVWVLVG